jgi:NADH dehydrogenase
MSALGTREGALSQYHRSKLAGEKVVQDSPLRWTIFRPAWIFGRNDEIIKKVKDIIDHRIVPLINGGKARQQPVSLEDVCSCMARAVVMPQTQEVIFEMGGPDRIPFRDVVQKTASILGAKINIISTPAWSVRPLVRLFQRFAFFPVTVDQIRMLIEDNVCEIDPYVKAFQLEPKSFVKSLPSLVE